MKSHVADNSFVVLSSLDILSISGSYHKQSIIMHLSLESIHLFEENLLYP